MKIEGYAPCFSGFYNSFWEFSDDSYDYEIEYVNEQREENGLSPLTIDQENDFYFDYNIDTDRLYEDVGTHFCQCIEDLFQENDFDIKVNYQNMHSPREYNFSTDTIYCEYVLDNDTYIKIIRFIEDHYTEKQTEDSKNNFKQFILDRFTSCSGFISFYSNCALDWINALWGNDFDTTNFSAIIEFLIIMLYKDNVYNTDNVCNEFDIDCLQSMPDYHLSCYMKMNNYDDYLNKENPKE